MPSLALALLGLFAWPQGSVGAGDAADTGEAGGATRATAGRVVMTADEPAGRLLETLAGRLEAAISVFEQETGRVLPEHERVVVHLFHDRERMLAACRAVRAGELGEHTATTAISNGESYVYLKSSRAPAYLEAVSYAPDALEAQVLHEAVHQFVYRTDPLREAFVPSWYMEGRAEHLGQLALGRTLPAPERSPWIASTASVVADAVRAGEARPLEELFAFTHEDGLPRDLLFYRQSTSLYAFLAQDPGDLGERFDRFVRALEERLTPESAGKAPDVHHREMTDRARELFRDAFGDDTAELEAAWRAWATQGCGEWFNEWAGCQWLGDELLVSANHGWSQSLLLCTEAPGVDAYRLLGRLAVEQGSACVFLGFVPEPLSFVRVDLAAEGLGLVAFEHGQWSFPAHTRARRPGAVPWLELEVEVSGRRVRARWGEQSVEAELGPGFDLRGGRWGLGATEGGLGRFRDVTCE